MPRYDYPLTMQPQPAAIQRADPIAVLDARDVLVMFARERIMKPGQIQVYRDKERKEELFKTIPSNQRDTRQQQFFSLAHDRVVGSLTEHRSRQEVRCEIADANSNVLYTMTTKPGELVRAAFKALTSGNLDAVPPTVFYDRRQQPIFDLRPVNKKGAIRLDLHDAEIKSGNEARMILAVISLMVWWDNDNMI